MVSQYGMQPHMALGLMNRKELDAVVNAHQPLRQWATAAGTPRGKLLASGMAQAASN
jgi:hypothetical protein